ncbi:MAG: regulatory protein RecX [Deltaproteobacteria bacterium]|nr:regulatory protein RecX [Deltaproteobacteria bacterium]
MATKHSANKEEALKKAVKFLGLRPRSETEVRTRLTRLGFSREIVTTTLERLRSLNYLNDESFARAWAVGKAGGRGYGPLRIESELEAKGIAKPLIQKVIKEIFGNGEGKEQARVVLEKRFRGRDLAKEAKLVRRAIVFLQRRGYRNSVIAELVQQPIEDE